MTQMKQAWTYSKIEKFETCPRQYNETTNKKRFPFVETDATRWGKEVHTAFEDRLRYKSPLPENMSQWASLLDKLDQIPGQRFFETKLAVSKSFESVDYWTAWSRGDVDYAVINKADGLLLDWKTGKQKPSEQLVLYAGYAFAHWPQLERIQTGFVWLKNRKIEKKTFTRAAVPVIWQEFVPRVRRLEKAYEEDQWPARPSGLCNGWCPVTDCEHYKAKAQ